MGAVESGYLAVNIKQLRSARGLSQQQCAAKAGIPRPTWSHLESGEANPTLSVLLKVAKTLSITVEELVQAPRAECHLYQAGSVPVEQRGGVSIQALLPETIDGLQIERLEFAALGSMTGVPHILGSREYLVCNSGRVELTVAGETWALSTGDVLVFRGDQKHSYRNPQRVKAS
nr:XRE family transcriptional regulator [Myxococcales bacterium]